MQARIGAPSTPSPFRIVDGFVEHPYIAPRTIEGREFQVRIAEQALAENTLVVVPTGLGKTLIAALVAAEVLRQNRGTVLMVCPTRPLAVQHTGQMRRLLRDEGLIHLLSGEVEPAERGRLWKSGILVVATPQTIRNDLEEGRYDLTNLALVIFDEAHRAVGDYAYVEIGNRLAFEAPKARVLGLTASPGAKRERLLEVKRNLHAASIQARETTSDDVEDYVQPVQVQLRTVDLTTTLRRVAKPFRDILQEQEEKLRAYGVVKGPRPFGLTKRELVSYQQSLGRQGFFAALHAASIAHYARLALDYAEVYGLDTLKRYLERAQGKTDARRYEKSFLKHAKTVEALELLAKGFESSHPKMDVLLEELRALRATRKDAIALVFVQYRDAVASIVEAIRAAGITAERLVGQASRGDEGQDQEEQALILQRFRTREFQVLVSTSVGEEGIDVPQVDLVVFYEAVPSEIRTIQRRGRTGRTVAGRVVMLVAKGTSDEGALKASVAREAKMKKLVSRYA